MKFYLACLVYLVMAAVLGWGMVLAVQGSPWLLIIAGIAYVVAFVKIGCTGH